MGYFHDRLRTSIGISRDRRHEKIARLGTDPTINIRGFVDAAGMLLPEGAAIPVFDINEQWSTNQSYGAVLRVLPWLSFTGAWLESRQFSENLATDLNGLPFPGLGGKGIDAGVRVNILDGRVTVAVKQGIDGGSQLGHIGPMSAIAKSRIDPELKRQAEGVLEEIGLKPRAALELFYKQIIKRRAIPFPVQADAPEDEVLSPAARRNELADQF